MVQLGLFGPIGPTSCANLDQLGPHGGLIWPHWASDLAQALHDHDEAVCVLARGAAARRHPFPIHPIHGRSWRRWQGLWSALWTLPRVTSTTTVICATWPVAATMAPWLQRRGARLLVAAHGSELTRLSTCPPALQDLARQALEGHHLETTMVQMRLQNRNIATLPWPIEVRCQ